MSVISVGVDRATASRAFFAILHRDVYVTGRELPAFAAQVILQPFFMLFVFGKVLSSLGYTQNNYSDLLFPGLVSLTAVLTAMQTLAFPLVAEFGWTREIEDRLLAPMEIEWLAVEKVIAGMIQSLVAGLVVLPSAWLIMGKGVAVSLDHPFAFLAIALLVGVVAASVGLTLGCSVGQTQIGLMFSLVLAPMIFFGCTYYPWSALATFPILSRVVLANPVVYASEGFRSTLAPQFPHLPEWSIFLGLILSAAFFFLLGLRQFRRKAII